MALDFAYYLYELLSPSFYFLPSIFKGQEPVFIQAFLPESAVEGFYKGVASRLAGAAEIQSLSLWPLILALFFKYFWHVEFT